MHRIRRIGGLHFFKLNLYAYKQHELAASVAKFCSVFRVLFGRLGEFGRCHGVHSQAFAADCGCRANFLGCQSPKLSFYQALATNDLVDSVGNGLDEPEFFLDTGKYC